jgi:hypothetical protein
MTDATREIQGAVGTAGVQPHPGRPHFWYRDIFTDGEPQCDYCRARPEDVVVDERGFDTGYVIFKAERVFGSRASEAWYLADQDANRKEA